MANAVKRRDGKGFEREIQTLTKLRTALVIDNTIDVETHKELLELIDALIEKLSKLLRRGINIAS